MDIDTDNVDLRELRKFSQIASRWWDLDGDLKTLHDINPLRVDYIDDRAELAGKRVLDVGCGGGILAEGMAARRAHVTGIDAAEDPLIVARLHRAESNAEIDYIQVLTEDYAREHGPSFDVITCLELLEHVPDPQSIIESCARLVRPGGHLFFSTINRNPKSYLFSIIGAEYLLKLLPQGTHEYARFIQPAELAGWARGCELRICDITGLTYNPLSGSYALGKDIDVNYLVHARKDDIGVG